MHLTSICIMVGCYLRTAASAVFLTQCTLRLHVECRAPYAYMCNGWVLLTHCCFRSVPYAVHFTFASPMPCNLRLYVQWLGATYALLLPQCSLHSALYVCILKRCLFRTIPYAVHLTFISVMVGCYLRIVALAVFLTQCTLRLLLE